MRLSVEVLKAPASSKVAGIRSYWRLNDRCRSLLALLGLCQRGSYSPRVLWMTRTAARAVAPGAGP